MTHRHRGRGVRLLAAALLTSFAFAPAAHAAGIAPTPDESWGVDGEVTSVAASGNHVFLGGFFDYVGPNTGNGIAVDATSGALPPAAQFPHVVGEIRAVASDGAGGWFIGGDFSRVGSTSVNRLAHINADGSLDTAFAPPTPDNGVDALAYGGGTLYLGGRFDQLGSSTRDYVAAVSGATGALKSFTANANDAVTSLALVPDASELYVGGTFTTIKGATRTLVAGITTAGSGALDAGLHPSVNQSGNRGYVTSLAVHGGQLYAGGNFDTVDAQPRGYGASFGTSDGHLTGWDPQQTFVTFSLATTDAAVYFTGGTSGTHGIHAVDPTTGAAKQSFDASQVNDVSTVQVSPDGATLYVAESTDSAGHRGLAALDAGTGAVKSTFKADAGAISCADCGVQAIAVAAGKVFVGGGFKLLGGQAQRNLAALDAGTGVLDPAFLPGGVYDGISALAVTGDGLVAASGFGLDARTLDTGSGVWHKDLDGSVTTLLAAGGGLYVGGSFSTVDGASRVHLARLAAGGVLDTDFTPPAIGGDGNSVMSLAATPGSLYVGGRFTTVGGEAHGNVANLDPVGGTLRSGFTATVDDDVKALAAQGSTAYLGGDFTGHLRAVNALTGATKSGFAASIDPRVISLADDGGRLYVGQDDEPGISTLDDSSGAVVGSAPGAVADGIEPGHVVDALVVDAGRLLAGGDFGLVGSAFRDSFASFSDPVPHLLVAPVLSPAPVSGTASTCHTGTWTSHPTSYDITYVRDGATIAGQTGTTYTPTDDDVGHQLACSVIAHTAAGAGGPAQSAAQAVHDAVPVNVQPPSLQASPHVADPATCQVGTWQHHPTSYTYQWKRDGAAIANAQSSTYTPVPGDQGHGLSCAVAAHNQTGSSAAVDSPALTVSAPYPPPTNTAKPVVTSDGGLPAVLSCSTGEWNPTPTAYAYAWTNPDGSAVPGQTQSTWQTSLRDRGHAYLCAVTATAHGQSATAASDPFQLVGPPTNTAKPTVTQESRDHNALDCAHGIWNNASETAYAYQWIDASGVRIGGATTPTYRLSAAQIQYGAGLVCEVTANGPGGSATATSDAFAIDGACTASQPNKLPAPKAERTDPCDAPHSTPVATQAQPIITRLTLACATGGGTGLLQARGCFTTAGKEQTYSGNLSIDGLDIQPVDSKTTVTISSADFDEKATSTDAGTTHYVARAKSTGAVEVFAGPVKIYQGTLNWRVPEKHAGDGAVVATFDPADGANVEGFPIARGADATAHAKGQGISITAQPSGRAQLSFDTQLPINGKGYASLIGASGLRSPLLLVTTLGGGLQKESLQTIKKNLALGPFSFGDVTLAYDQASDTWTGKATVEIPLYNELTVDSVITFVHGGFKGVEFVSNGKPFSLFPLVVLTKLGVGLQVDPLALTGTASVGIGVGNATPVSLEGKLRYDLVVPFVHVEGTGKVFGVPVFSAYVDAGAVGVGFGFQAGIGLPNFTDPDPSQQPISIDGSFRGWFGVNGFDLEGHVGIGLNFIEASVGVDAIASSKALAACAEVLFATPGFAYHWDGGIDLMWDGCGIGDYRVEAPKALARATGPGGESVALPGGTRVVVLHGGTAAPQPIVTGPGGVSATLPLDGSPLKSSSVVAFQDKRDKLTYVWIKDAKGSWGFTPQPGTAAITKIESAAKLPPPAVKATPSRRGAREAIHYDLQTQGKGETVQFAETTKTQTVEILKATRRTSGTFLFTPARGAGGRRSIIATVLKDGIPQRRQTVAHYVAPTRIGAANVTGLRAARVGTGLRVSWRSARDAKRYAVQVTGNGVDAGVLTSPHATHVIVPNVVRAGRSRVTATVRGIATDGVPGPAARQVAGVRVPKRAKRR